MSSVSPTAEDALLQEGVPLSRLAATTCVHVCMDVRVRMYVYVCVCVIVFVCMCVHV